MLDDKPQRWNSLMDEVASISSANAAGSFSVQLVNVSMAGVSFISPYKLQSQSPDTLSLRFSLPGKPRLHFASVALMAPPIHDDSGYRYTAKFVAVDPPAVEQIIEYLRPAPLDAAAHGNPHPGSYPLPSAAAGPAGP